MASMPPRQASQRHSSPVADSQRARSQSRARSASSDDSQTVLLNTSSIIRDQEAPAEASTSASASTSTSASTVPAIRPLQDDADLKKCWICFSDETEDMPDSSDWRDPCPCALVAHEDCLLDWIADMESPSSRKRTLGPPQIVCPQCKAEIHLARPRNYLVEAVKALERLSARIVTPGALIIALSTVVHASTAHGIHSIQTVFGVEDGYRILQPLMYHVLHPRQITGFADVRDVFAEVLTHWRLHVGLPLITPLLVLSRTTLADSVLPVLPIVFFATQGDSDQPLDFGSWPPSASLAFAVLPYVRGLYNTYYERVWAEKEKQWLKDIQPRSGRPDEGEGAAEIEAQNGAADDEVVAEDNNFEIRIDGNIWDEWVDDEDADVDQAEQQRERNQIRQDMLQNGPAPGEQAPPFNAPPLADDQPAVMPRDDGQAAPQNVAGGRQQQRPQQNAAAGHQERLLSFSTSALAEKILGALFFPTVASLSGEALRAILPRAWTSRPTAHTPFGLGPGRATGLLQHRWGRSIVGGCLFVIVKDAVMLYVRWKMAQQHRRRHILDYDRKTKKVR
ncbi:hypothetical protein MBLNU459_g1826t1 [Dothideomycetes sp. NU459]